MTAPDLMFPDIEDVLMAYLTVEAAWTDTEPPEAEMDEAIQINRVGGHSDDHTDYPRVQITCHARDPRDASKLGRRVQQRMLAIAGNPIEVEDEPKPICVDFCHTDTPPEPDPMDNPDRRRHIAFYRLGLQRPWRK